MFARCEHSGEIAAILLSILLQNSMQNSVSTILQAKSLYVNAALRARGTDNLCTRKRYKKGLLFKDIFTNLYYLKLINFFNYFKIFLYEYIIEELLLLKNNKKIKNKYYFKNNYKLS